MTFLSREMKQILFALAFIFSVCLSLPEQGIWHFDVDEIHDFVAVSKVVYKNSRLYIKVNCDDQPTKTPKINVSFIVWLLPCYERGLQFDKTQDLEDMRAFHFRPDIFHVNNIQEESSYFVNESPIFTYECGFHSNFVIHTLNPKNFVRYSLTPTLGSSTKMADQTDKSSTTLEDQLSGGKRIADTKDTKDAQAKSEADPKEKSKREANEHSEKKDEAENEKQDKTKEEGKKTTEKNEVDKKKKTEKIEIQGQVNTTKKDEKSDKKKTEDISHLTDPQFVFINEGVYIVSLLIIPAVTNDDRFRATVDFKIKGDDGYLSATEWPLLPFYGVMCAIYVIYGIAWLIISACQWRDLLRIQFWIGGVIFLGMLEKAVFFGEYQSLNNTGKSVQGAVVAAEIVSCLKRTLARMLIIIVSLGFGIVKPRLGPLLHRVVGVGALYFILSLVEGLMRVLGVRNDPYHQFWLATIALAVLDSFICYWISLVQTTRTLRLRRNIVKLNLYRHFTNTLIFAVVASVAFMIWSLRTYQGLRCIKDWKELWIDEAYWRLFFSVILLVIMILWRPTNNNQRYAFTPLLDAADDEDDEIPLPDSFDGMKMRGNKNQNHASKGVEDDLKWIDENIPSGISDVALPSLLDSDEEIMTTKFEMSKMN